MKRILMTADAVGGVWSYALDLARALRRSGTTVHLAVLGTPPSNDQRRQAGDAGVALTEIGGRLEWMDDCWPDVDRAGERLLRLERDIGADVVHLNGYAHAAMPWRAPVIVAAHSCVCSWWRAVYGEPAPERFDEYRRRVMRGLRAASIVVAPSHAMLEALREEYGEVPQGRVIPNGTSFRPLDQVAREPLVLSAGRVWDEAKNVMTLCAAASSIPWPVFVAGHDRDPEGRQFSIHGVRHLGALTRAALREWYSRAAIYALPARYEPFGLSVLEAARAGCALVLGDIPSLRENWTGAAVFVAPGDAKGLAAAIAGLATNDQWRRQLSSAAYARASRFAARRMAAAYAATYALMAEAVA